jgi:hypothetical protein
VTLIIGILCKDGVVIASDSEATFGTGTTHTIGKQHVQKVTKVNDHILHASTGAVGMAQIIADHLKAMWDDKVFSGTLSPDAAMDRLGKAIGALVAPYMQTAQIQRNLTGSCETSLCKSLLAIPISRKPYLFQFDFNGAPERATADLPFVCLGSGQPIADPFLALIRRLFWTTQEPNLAEGRLAAVWTIDHVRRISPGGVGGNTQIACLEPTLGANLPMVKFVDPAEIQEHMQKIESAEAAIVDVVRMVPQSLVPPTIPTMAHDAAPVARRS